MAMYLGLDKVANGGGKGSDYDALPAGAIVEFDGDEIPAGFERVDETEFNIVEKGSTSTCKYVKFSDGTMVIRGKFTAPALSGGGAYVTIEFPDSFVDTDYDVTFGLCNGGAYWSWLVPSVQTKNKTDMSVQIWSNTSSSSGTTDISFIIIGDYK